MQKQKKETLKHFLIECVELKTIRNKIKNVRNEYEIKKILLLFEEDQEKIKEGKKTFLEMWNERKRRLSLKTKNQYCK